VLILAMAACCGAMDTGAKWLGAFVPVLLMLWVRHGTQALVRAIRLARLGAAGFRSAHARYQLSTRRAGAGHQRDVVLRRAAHMPVAD
jgi:hypothetical protein